MNPGIRLAGLSLGLLSPIFSYADTTPLHVMLQGESAQAMEQLIATHGGRLTHDLPIINAVGAELSREQLDNILATNQVIRFIDDLSISDQPPVEEQLSGDACDVGGAVEAQISASSIAWDLFNKDEQAAELSRLELSWPEPMGLIESITLGDSIIPASAYSGATAGFAEVSLNMNEPVSLDGRQTLEIVFSAHAEQKLPAQSSFNLKASFQGGCDTQLIPGYTNNDEDFFYSTVAGADNLHLHGVRGAGVTVAVLDSGLWDHRALTHDTQGKERVVARYNAISDSNDVFDESGHGTHLTSVIAHSGETTQEGRPTGSYKGVAPDVKLAIVKAFNVEGQGGMLDIVRGVQWVVENREAYNIRVLNLSFAARPRWQYWLDPINQAVMQAWAAGIVVVAAAGNEGPEPMTVGSPGNLPYVITVGAVTDSWTGDTRSDDYIPDFSSQGPTPEGHIKPDVVAPGGHITGITRPGSSLTKDHPEYMLGNGDFVMTGSSQAAALVSGVAALLLQLEPDLSPDDVKCKLTSSAEPAINRDGLLAYSPFQQGHGYINATRAITLGETGCGNADLDLQQDLAMERHFEGPAIVEKEGMVSLPGLQQMLSPLEAEKGASDTRVWGVKDHVERIPADEIPPPGQPFEWQQMYERERRKIEKLAEE